MRKEEGSKTKRTEEKKQITKTFFYNLANVEIIRLRLLWRESLASFILRREKQPGRE